MSLFMSHLFNRNWRLFQWRYLRGRTPWDTRITPPEVTAFIAGTPPGTALDLGCGTGTNAMTLARHGWRVTGVDFIAQAIRRARSKAAQSNLEIEFIETSVLDLDMLGGPFTYILDIGCLHGLNPDDRPAYAANLKRLLAHEGWYMLYAWHPRLYKGGRVGISVEEVAHMLGNDLARERIETGEENGHPSAWYWYRRRPAKYRP